MIRVQAFLLFALASAACTQEAGDVTRQQFTSKGLIWPFTVEHGTLGCTGRALWFSTDGRRYALNGRARSQYEYADPVLKIDDVMMRRLRATGDRNPYEVRLSTNDAMNEARKLCD